MKKITVFVVCLFLAFHIKTIAQWERVTEFDHIVNDMKVFNGKLYFGGSFEKHDGLDCYRSCEFDAINFKHHPYVQGSLVQQFEAFNDTLYASAYLNIGSSVVKWTGTQWIPGIAYGNSLSLHAAGDYLFMGGGSGDVASASLHSNTVSLYPTFTHGNNIKAVHLYNNELIVAGQIYSHEGQTINNIARWDGSTWRPMGDGLKPNSIQGLVYKMVIYNGELYAGGCFQKSGNLNVGHIAKWNGESWSSVLGGVNGATNSNIVKDMVVDNGYLYVAGKFTQMGGLQTRFVSRWNGSEWQSIPAPSSALEVFCIEIYKHHLYIAAWEESGFVIYRRSLIQPLSVNEQDIDQIKLYPNPSKGIIYLDGLMQNANIDIIDMLGRKLMSQTAQIEKTLIDVSHLAAGEYSILIHDQKIGNLLATKKFIKL